MENWNEWHSKLAQVILGIIKDSWNRKWGGTWAREHSVIVEFSNEEHREMASSRRERHFGVLKVLGCELPVEPWS
jgi:hypothetical protein